MTDLSGLNLDSGAAAGPQDEGMESPSTFPAYQAYKNSGVEWLGEVPEHWTVIALKWLSPVFRGRLRDLLMTQFILMMTVNLAGSESRM